MLLEYSAALRLEAWCGHVWKKSWADLQVLKLSIDEAGLRKGLVGDVNGGIQSLLGSGAGLRTHSSGRATGIPGWAWAVRKSSDQGYGPQPGGCWHRSSRVQLSCDVCNVGGTSKPPSVRSQTFWLGGRRQDCPMLLWWGGNGEQGWVWELWNRQGYGKSQKGTSSDLSGQGY